MRSCSRAGSAAEPETSSRARASAAPTAAFSSAAAASRWYIVGTANSIVPVGGQLLRDRVRGEAAHVDQPAADPGGPEGAEDEPVRVEERQPVHEDVPRRPLPYLGKRVEIRGDGTAGQHDALRQPGGARRVENQRGSLRVGLRREHGTAAGGGVDLEALHAGKLLRQRLAGAAEHERRRAVRHEVLELALAAAGIDGHCRDAGADRAQDGDGGLQPQRRPHGHALAALQPRRERRHRGGELGPRERTPVDADRLPRPWSLERGKQRCHAEETRGTATSDRASAHPLRAAARRLPRQRPPARWAGRLGRS